jgi:hypothetical protein
LNYSEEELELDADADDSFNGLLAEGISQSQSSDEDFIKHNLVLEKDGESEGLF